MALIARMAPYWQCDLCRENGSRSLDAAHASVKNADVEVE